MWSWSHMTLIQGRRHQDQPLEAQEDQAPYTPVGGPKPPMKQRDDVVIESTRAADGAPGSSILASVDGSCYFTILGIPYTASDMRYEL
eukprot:scaffold528331_cov14-Prasinocladus_malaysianus.AAC.1